MTAGVIVLAYIPFLASERVVRRQDRQHEATTNLTLREAFPF